MNGRRFSEVVRNESTPWPWPVSAAGPCMVVCPIQTTGVAPAAVQELYRLAYERAVAATRPSRFERLLSVSQN